MLVLGIDTATRRGSVGVVAVSTASEPDAAPACALVAEVSRDAGLQHGEALLPLIDECLAQAGVALEGIGAIAVSIGPGSFTGLRVGLATAKGLVLGTPASLIGVPTLEALAATLVGDAAAGEGGAEADGAPGAAQRWVVGTCLDARRGEVYGAVFSVAPGAGSAAAPAAVERLSEDAVFSPEAFADHLLAVVGGQAGGASAARHASRAVVVGDGADRHASALHDRLGGAAELLPGSRVHPRGAAVAALGARLLRERGPDEPARLAPLYARLSDAERVRAARVAAAAADAGPRR